MQDIGDLHKRHYPHMQKADKDYLGTLLDSQQYPATRYAMNVNVFMFDCESTASIKAINSANKMVKESTVVGQCNHCAS